MMSFCFAAAVEPNLQPLQGESFKHKTTTTEADGRLDTEAIGLWDRRLSTTFLNLKVFNPFTKTCAKSIPETFKFHENQKKLKSELK